MSLATATSDLWQNEQRSTSSEPVRVLRARLLHSARCQPELESRAAFPVRSNPGRSRVTPVRKLPRSARWRALSRTLQCCRTVKLFNHNFDTLRCIVSAILGTTFEAVRGKFFASQHLPGFALLFVLENNAVNNAVFLALLRIHDEVAFHIPLHFFQPLTAVLGQKLAGDLAHAQNLAGMDVDICCLPR